jgi:excisionase family DNA binding protein
VARQPNDYPPIMDTSMVGELLQMSPVHVRRLAREGVIPAYRIEGVRAFKFKRDEVLAWFEGQKVDLTNSMDITLLENQMAAAGLQNNNDDYA